MKKASDMVARNRFLVLIAGVILISGVWVVVSVSIYMNDGTHLLDLSRPGYEPAREQVRGGTPSQEKFSDDGPVDEAALQEFLGLYRERTAEIDKFDSFDSEALTTQHLKIAP